MKESIKYANEEFAKLQEMEDYYCALMSKFSHEIRNPLTLLNSSLQLLENVCPAVKENFLWPQIREDMQDIIKLLQDMSSFNKSKNVTLSPIEFTAFVKKTAASFRPMAKERGIRFSCGLSPELSSVTVPGDEIKLREVITNLLINAMDAVTDCPDAEITLSAAPAENGIHIHVRDNGCGIPDEYLPTLFEPFITHKTNGTGLGLAVVHNTVEKHGGSVTVETSTEENGSYTDFCIYLPM